MDWMNIKSSYNRFSARFRNFLLSSKSREFLLFLCFFLVSATFWLLQTLNEPYETDITIPLRLENVPEEAVITDNPPSEIKVTVRDKGTVLITYLLGNRLLPVGIDFQKYQASDSHVKISSGVIENLLSSRLSASTKLLGIRPSIIEYYYSIGERRMLPVKLHAEVRTQMEYIATDTLMRPDSVLVFAPSDILNAMQFVDTDVARFEDITDTVQLTVPLRPVKGAKFIPSSVHVTVPVDLLTEKTVEVPVIGIGFPEDKILRTFPSRVKVRFLVAFHRFLEIDSDDFSIHVQYTDLLNAEGAKCRLTLDSIPEGVSHVRIEPESVDFLIEQSLSDVP